MTASIVHRAVQLRQLLAGASLCLVIAGCGGGGDGTAPAETVTPPPVVVPTTIALSGTAATGAPAANAAITAVCAGSTTAFTATAGADGRFSITVAQAPCLLRATFGTPAQSLYAITTQAGVVDISPFSDLVVAAWGQGLPDAVFASIDAAHPLTVDATALADAVALVRRRVANAGVNVTALDLLHQPFAAQAGDPYDDAIEALHATTTPQANYRADVAAGRDAPLATLPTTPTITLAEAGDGVVRISWPQAEAGVSYAVYFDLDNSGPGGTSITRLAAGGSSPVIVGGLVNGSAYVFQVRASNAAGTVSSAFTTKAPKATGLLFANCPAGIAGCFDPTRADPGFGAFYTGMAYTRYGGQDHYIAVKSSLQIMRMVDDLPPEHVQFPAGAANLMPLNAVAASPDGVVLAVGDGGLLMRSDDAGLRWSITNMNFGGVGAQTIRYASITYGDGKFVAVGSYADTFGTRHDLIVTHPAHFVCGVGANCTTFSGTTAYTPPMYSQLNQVAFGGGRFVALGSGNGYIDAGGASQFSNASYTSLDASAWNFATPTGIAAFPGGADKLVYFANLFWGLVWQGDTGGSRSTDGTAWNGSDWQVTNPGNFINDMAVGVGQLVAVDAGGYTYVNKSGLPAKTAWTGSSPSAQLSRASLRDEKNLVVYGNGRYVAISNGYVYVSK